MQRYMAVSVMHDDMAVSAEKVWHDEHNLRGRSRKLRHTRFVKTRYARESEACNGAIPRKCTFDQSTDDKTKQKERRAGHVGASNEPCTARPWPVCGEPPWRVQARSDAIGGKKLSFQDKNVSKCVKIHKRWHVYLQINSIPFFAKACQHF